MNVEELARGLSMEIVAGERGKEKEICGVYVCDLLSRVIAKAEIGFVWVTVHTHLNIVAVAVLKELSCIIIPENLKIDNTILVKAEEEGVPILLSSKTAFEISYAIGKQEIM